MEMSDESDTPTTLVLYADAGLGQIRVDGEAFVKFSRQLNHDLLKLIARWADKAAPAAGNPRRRRSARAKP
jgi:hypothetical protein